MSPDDLAAVKTDLYETDFYAWTQAQAQLLRAHKSETLPGLEWERLAEEIEDVGKSEYRQAASLITRIIEHLYKLSWSQRPEPKGGWRSEIVGFRASLRRTLTASLRAKMLAELEDIHRDAAAMASAQFETSEPNATRDETLRWTLPQILGESDDPIA